MMRYAREFRLLPVVLFAAVCLFTLKMIGIVTDGGYTLAGMSTNPASEGPAAATGAAKLPPLAPGAKQSWAQEMFNYPDVTGSIDEKKPSEKVAATTATAGKINAPVAAPEPASKVDGTLVRLDGTRPASAAERAVLERLQERRQEIEARAREIDIRDGLLKAAEKRLETRLKELKDVEARVNAAMQKKDDADAVRFKSIVMMYENMKAKDAAKIFDRLDMTILMQVATQLNPRRMSDIMGQMLPEAAERLTVELANRASSAEKMPSASDLPKISGKPSGL
jgi:flagellar motility protein MotE (MotC chaperone)